MGTSRFGGLKKFPTSSFFVPLIFLEKLFSFTPFLLLSISTGAPNLITAQTERLREIISRVMDGLDTPTLMFMPRENPNEQPKIRSATIEQLVERATYERYPGMEFFPSFVLTRNFFFFSVGSPKTFFFPSPPSFPYRSSLNSNSL